MKPIHQQSDKPRTPARAQLASAIAARDAEAKRVIEAQEAAARVAELVTAWEQKLLDANQQARAARDVHAQKIADAAKTGTPLAALGETRAAITAELEARDALDAAHKAAEISEAALSAVEQTLKEAEAAIKQAADDVIRSVDANAMLDEMEATQNRLMSLRLMHRFYRTNKLYPPDKDSEARAERLCFFEFAPSYGQPEYQQFDAHPRYLDWQNARDALHHDADAPLPGEPLHQPLPLPPDPLIKMNAENASVRAAMQSMVARRAAADAEAAE